MPEIKFNIDRIAALARLKLADSEKLKLEGHLVKIIEYIDQLNKLDTADVEPTSHVLPLSNVFRADELEKRFPNADLLKQAPKQEQGHYEVPQIIN